MDRVTAAKVFVDVVYSGSFTATAERLDMSRPMVTRYVEAMENWLQTRFVAPHHAQGVAHHRRGTQLASD